MSRKIKKNSYVYPLLVVIGFICYYRALFAPFAFDDYVYVVRNPWVRSLGNLTDPSPLRYVGDLSFALNYLIFGPLPFSFHLVNVLIHIANAFLVFSFINLIFEAPLFKRTFLEEGEGRAIKNSIALITALVFLAHPINTQAVTYVTQRYTSLVALFYLGAVVLYLKARIRLEGGGKKDSLFAALYLGAIISTVLAMKTKETAFTLPFVIFMLEVSLFYGHRRLSLLIPFLLTLFIIPAGLFRPEGLQYAGINRAEEFMRHKKLRDLGGVSPYVYLMTEATVIPAYLRMLFLPVNQHFLYDWPLQTSFFAPSVLAGLFFIGVFLLASFWGLVRSIRRAGPYLYLVSFGILWFFVTLSVESSLIPIQDVINEHRVYLPGMGIVLATVTALFYLKRELERRYSVKVNTILFTVLIALAATTPLTTATVMRNGVWSNRLRLYIDETGKNPSEYDAHLYLGTTYYEMGRIEAARKEFLKALELKPGFYSALNDLAILYYSTGEYDRAEKVFKEAIDSRPDIAFTHVNLGLLYIKRGTLEKAAAEFEKALAIEPWNKEARQFLKKVMAMQLGARGVD